jgi:hypothetical protein
MFDILVPIAILMMLVVNMFVVAIIASAIAQGLMERLDRLK